MNLSLLIGKCGHDDDNVILVSMLIMMSPSKSGMQARCRCPQGSLVALCTKTSHRVSQRNKLNQMTQKHFVTVMLVKSFCNAQSTNLSSPHSDFTDGLLGSYKALQLRKSGLKWKKEVQKDCLAASLFPLETRASVHL